jgi:hypothetical protein
MITHTRYELGCHCPRCTVRYIETSASACTYGTTPRRRYSHAVPEGSNVALCGTVPTGNPSRGDTPRCPDCEALAQQRSWVGR